MIRLKDIRLASAILFALFLNLDSVEATSVGATATPTAAASPQLFPPRSPAIPAPSATPTVSATVTPAEAKTLLKEFRKAQDAELSALKHRQKVEYSELKAAHKAQRNEWESKEKEARHKFFAEHKSGPDRRTYIQDFSKRREIMLKIQSDEEDRRTRDYSVRIDSLKNEQAQKLKEFQEYLGRGERPPVALWPS